MKQSRSIVTRLALEELLTESGALIECGNADQCFSCDQWGWLSYDDPESNSCGGKPWSECFCATEAQRRAADVLNGKCIT